MHLAKYMTRSAMFWTTCLCNEILLLASWWCHILWLISRIPIHTAGFYRWWDQLDSCHFLKHLALFWLAGIEQLWLVHFKDVFPQKVAGAQLSYCCHVFWLLTTMLVGFYSTVPFHSIKVVIFYGERNLSSMTWLRTVELKFHKHQSQQSRNTTKSELCRSKGAHLVMNPYSWA